MAPSAIPSTCRYTAHPAVGLEVDRRRAYLFGEARPPFEWMRLPTSQQDARSALFYQVLLREITRLPMLDVRATFPDGEGARRVASSTGLPVDGCTVTGHAPDSASVLQLAEEPWQELEIATADRPLLSADRGRRDVDLWLGEQHADAFRAALAPPVAEGSVASARRTRWAAALIALDYAFLAVVIAVGVVLCRAADHYTPTVIAILIAVVIVMPLVWPLQAIGKSIQRRYYENRD